jgi:hypothetical protein
MQTLENLHTTYIFELSWLRHQSRFTLLDKLRIKLSKALAIHDQAMSAKLQKYEQLLGFAGLKRLEFEDKNAETKLDSHQEKCVYEKYAKILIGEDLQANFDAVSQFQYDEMQERFSLYVLFYSNWTVAKLQKHLDLLNQQAESATKQGLDDTNQYLQLRCAVLRNAFWFKQLSGNDKREYKVGLEKTALQYLKKLHAENYEEFFSLLSFSDDENCEDYYEVYQQYFEVAKKEILQRATKFRDIERL